MDKTYISIFVTAFVALVGAVISYLIKDKFDKIDQRVKNVEEAQTANNTLSLSRMETIIDVQKDCENFGDQLNDIKADVKDHTEKFAEGSKNFITLNLTVKNMEKDIGKMDTAIEKLKPGG